MAYSVDASLNVLANIRETLADVPAAASPVVQHSSFGVNKALDASSTPPATLHASSELALVAGAKTIDLAALAGTQGTVDLTGTAPRWLLFTNTGAAAMTFAKGASNGLDLNGATWSLTLAPGDTAALYLTASDDVSSTLKTIDVSGTGTDTFRFQVIAG